MLKEHILDIKFEQFYDFKIRDDECYFAFIQSYTLLNNYFENKDFFSLFNIIEKLSNIIISNEEIEKKLSAYFLFKNLHILYLYFSNYPYIYGALSDDEIDIILSDFKPDISKIDLNINIAAGYNALIKIADNLATRIEKGISIINDKENLKKLQRLLILINCSNEQLLERCNISELKEYYQVKNYLKDIDFCLGNTLIHIINIFCKNYPLKFEIGHSYLNKDKRYFFYKSYALQVSKRNDIENEQTKIYNQSIKYNNTIVLGDKYFHDIINKINLPCENIYYLNEEQFSNFFQVPKKINGKYNICKYFIIMDEINGNKYIETIKYISNVFGLKFVTIIFIQNKNIKINKKILHNPFIYIILTYSEKDILNFYYDNYTRLKETNITYMDENERFEKEIFDINCQFSKLSETKIIKEQDNGWDMIRNINTNIFKLVSVDKIFGYIDAAKFNRDMFKVYKENNCLDLFYKYYGNYFSSDYLLEQITPLVATVKMFLYAYTLEESNGKSFYSLMNNDLRSGDTQKICRYLPMMSDIHRLIKSNYLKSYCGDVYRATYFKKELIDEIHEGKKMLNASLWSSSKKLSVARKFLFKYKKNILLHTKVKEGNNIDIHLEKLSQFPNEEEILFLPFCFFEIKSFTKTKENGLEYYNLELIYCEEENKNNKVENVELNNITYCFDNKFLINNILINKYDN